MDAHAGTLVFPAHAGEPGFLEPGDGSSGPREWRREWLRRLDQARLTVPLLQPVVTDKDQALDRQARGERVGIAAADDRDPQQVTVELAEQRDHLRRRHRLVG